MVNAVVIGSCAEAFNTQTKQSTQDIDFIVRNLSEAHAVAKHLTNGRDFYMDVLSDSKVVYHLKRGEEPIDWNYSSGILHIECTIAWDSEPHNQILDQTDGWIFGVADMETLYWIRHSHKYLKNSPHFLKTRQALGRLSAYKILGNVPKWYKALEEYHYNYKHPALNVSKGEFFKDDFYVYDHDHIHELVAIGKTPAYQSFLVDEVKCSRELFEAQRYDIKLNAVIEESLVLAIERALVPHPDKLNLQQAYNKALQKVCTSITSGWFREFAYDHYDVCTFEMNSLLINSLYRNFKKAAVAGTVRPFKQS